MKLLLVIDMQNDFIDGALGTPEAAAIVADVAEHIRAFDGPVICTLDTHTEDYMHTAEGRSLPVVHCVKGTRGWELNSAIAKAAKDAGALLLTKPAFGSTELPGVIRDDYPDVDSIEMVGICTDICVISNAMILKAFLPEIPLSVDSSLCAGVTPEQHQNALEAMKPCQIEII